MRFPMMTSINGSFLSTALRKTPNSLHLGSAPTPEGREVPYYLPAQIRDSHLHILGATGSGKSKLIEYMIRQDIEQGNGACLIDPHGDLYKDVLKYAIEHRCVDRVIPFDPTNDAYVLGFNPISYQGDISFKAKQLREACGKAWGVQNWDDTPRLARWLYCIFYVLLEQNLTMLDSLTLVHLSHTPKRAELVKKIQHPQIRQLFQEIEQMRPHEIREQLESSYNRLFEFLNNTVIRRMFAQKETINFRSLMNEGKILLCNLSTRNQKISTDDRNLLGTLLLHEFYSNALLREPQERTPFYLYIDEFSNFVSLDVAQGLAETRKFKLGYVLAHQDLAQLKEFDEKLYKAVMTNARSKIVFGGLCDEDRELLSKEVFAPDFDVHAIKDEIYQTKQRGRLELREVEGRSTSTTDTFGSGRSTTDTVSTAHSSSETHTTSQSATRGTSTTQGVSRGFTQGTSESYQQNHGRNYGTTSSQNIGWNSSTSEGATWNQGTSQNQSTSDSTSLSTGENETRSNTHGTSTGTSSVTHTEDCSVYSITESQGQQQSTTYGGVSTWVESQGTSVTLGSGTSQSYGGSSSISSGQSFGLSHGTSEGVSHGESRGQSTSQGVTDTQSYAQGRSESTTEGTAHARSQGVTEGVAQSVSLSETTAQSFGKSTSVSQTWVTVHDEYSELSSRTFYSLEEQLHGAKSYFAKLQPAQMIIKVHSEKAVPVHVPFVTSLEVKLQWYQGFMKKVSDQYPFFMPLEKAFQPSLDTPRPQQHHQNPPKEKTKKPTAVLVEPAKQVLKEEKTASDEHFYDVFNPDLI